jgi:hypothetical protein
MTEFKRLPNNPIGASTREPNSAFADRRSKQLDAIGAPIGRPSAEAAKFDTLNKQLATFRKVSAAKMAELTLPPPRATSSTSKRSFSG